MYCHTVCQIPSHASSLEQVPAQFPPEVQKVLERQGNTAVIWDYSQPNFEDLKARRSRYFTPM